MGYVKFVYGILGTIAALIAAIYILKLKNWAKKLIIILSIIAILSTIWVMYESLSDGTNMENLHIFVEEKMKPVILQGAEKLKPEYQKNYIQKQKTIINTAVKAAPIFYYAALIAVFLWNSLIIYFFTRPEVKKQFKQGNE